MMTRSTHCTCRGIGVAAVLVALLLPRAAAAAVEYAGTVNRVTVGSEWADLELTGGALARVEMMSPDVVRVKFAPRGRFSDERSGALSSTAFGSPAVSIIDTPDVLYLVTSRVTVAVVKAPYRVVVWSANGALIGADLVPAVGWDTDSGLVFARKYAPPDEHYFGLGERGGAVNRRGRSFFMKNIDFAGYGELTDPLYVTIPFFYSLRQGQASGLFLDNPAFPFFDFDSSGSGTLMFGAQEGDLDYYILAGPEPARVAGSYSRLTGTTPLPPKWSLGFQQSRYGYKSQDELLSLAASFRALQIPCDALYMDLDYMEGAQQLTWNAATFPDPAAMNRALETQGFRRINIVEPFVLSRDRTWPFMAGSNFFLTRPDGSPFVSQIFLGQGSWIDFTRSTARDWYKQVLKMFLSTGVSAVWNDLNEPADNFMPDAIYDFDGRPRPDGRARNVFALHQTSLSYQAQQELRPNVRPWVLSRGGYAGIQRYAANWSGDTLTSFDSLRVSIQMSASMGLSGQNQFGHDIGGFLGSPSAELYLRWLEFGSMTPFFRTHSVDTSAPREPWAFGEPYTSMARSIINRRYQWLPYMYSLFERASRTGEPVLAPTFFHFPSDAETYRQDTAFMLGANVLVAPVFTEGATTQAVYLPAGVNWVDYHTDAVYPGGRTVVLPAPLGRVPLLVREGAIVPGGPIRQHVGDNAVGPLTVDLYAGPDASFSLYEDDGISLEYAAGRSLRRQLTLATRVSTSEFTAGASEGTFVPSARSWLLHFHNVPATPLGVTRNGLSLAAAGSEAALDGVEAGWFYRAADNRLLVRVPDTSAGFTVVVKR
jgi:alpha-glucosidase